MFPQKIVTKVRFFQYNINDSNDIPYFLERLSYFLNIASINISNKTIAIHYAVNIRARNTSKMQVILKCTSVW